MDAGAREPPSNALAGDGARRRSSGNAGSDPARERQEEQEQARPVGQTYRVLYGNARSLIKKMDELKCLAADVMPDVICICESWTNIDHTDTYLSIDNYSLECRRDRIDTTAGKGGGLLIYIPCGLTNPP